jgi:hypothetical protein
MNMSQFRLTCFDKPAFEDSGLEFFVCNGGGGLAGVRRTADASHRIYVRDQDVVLNLEMQIARKSCGSSRFGVRADSDGNISFVCDGKATEPGRGRFQAATRSEWKDWQSKLRR